MGESEGPRPAWEELKLGGNLGGGGLPQEEWGTAAPQEELKVGGNLEGAAAPPGRTKARGGSAGRPPPQEENDS